MPYANRYSGREEESEEEESEEDRDYIGSRSRSRSRSRSKGWTVVALMPPEPLPPWDRKGEFFRERNHQGGGGGGGSGSGSGSSGGRWRDPPSSPFAPGSRNSSEFSPRWGFPSSDFRRPPGHSKQGGWHSFQEDSPHGYSTPRSVDRFQDDDSLRQSGPRSDGLHGRFYRDNRNGSGQKDWRGHSWENNHPHNGPVNTPGRPHSLNSQRSVVESPIRPSHPNTDPSPQSNSKDQADRTGDANGSGENQKTSKENSSGSLDWKPLKWSRSGSLTSRGSGFSHSSSSKSMGGESNDATGDLAPKNVTHVQSPPGDVTGSDPSGTLPEDTSSRKKPRLGWGEGLAKYEKKKVDGPEENVTKIENAASVCNVEPTHSVTSILVDKSPKITGFSDCSSPATPSSFACSSSPGLEKTYGKMTDGDSHNFSVSSMPLPDKQADGLHFNLEKLELNSITNLSSLLGQLLQVDDQCSMDSGFMRSSAFNKLLLWKGDISKVLELTEVEIDSLENELKLVKANSGDDVPCPGSSNVLHVDDKDGGSVGLNGFTRPLPLDVVLSEDKTVEKILPSHCVRGVHGKIKDEEIDSPGTATSRFVELLSAQNLVSSSGLKRSCSEDNEVFKSSRTVFDNQFSCDNEEITEGTSCQGDDAMSIKGDSVLAVVDSPGVCNQKECNICDIIFASNKDTASKASDVFAKLLPNDNNVNVMEAVRLSCLPSDAMIKERFLKRKRLLKFKERALSLKYRAFHYLWKEELRLLSSVCQRTKPQKKLDLTSRSIQIGNQKQRSSIRSRFASSVGSSSLVPTTGILNFTSKLLSDSALKIYRSNLKMPAMILDEKEKISSRFVSSNGLVEDPCSVEKERSLTNPWTTEEKEIFMEKLSLLGKDFSKIASFLDHKTIADCVQFYYKNHKSEGFEKTKKLDVKKQTKPLSSDTYMLTSGKKWSRDMNSASLHVLGEASVMAAQADQAMKSSKLSNKKPRGSDGNFAEDERETVAADVLAGICGSFSSEAMSSCITSSVDPTDGNHEWKYHKVKQPLTPDATQNGYEEADDDDTCSDESCEVDPVDWTDDEKLLFIRAFSSHGKDFLMISRFVRTKSRDQCKVFFSKARKCLGLETLLHPGSNDTNGGGSVVEDACHVETGSVGCSGNSGSGMDEDLPHVSPDVSKPDSTGPSHLDCKDTDMDPEVLCPGDNPADTSNLCPDESDESQKKAHVITQDDMSKTFATICGSNPHVSSYLNPESFAEVTYGNSVSTCEDKDPNAATNYCGSWDGQGNKATHCDSSSLNSLGETEKLTGLPLVLSIKPETKTNGDLTHKSGSESKVQPFQECYFRKCSRTASQNAVSELPLLPKGEGMVPSSSNIEKPCTSGDVKLFGKILSKPSPVNIATSSVQCYDETANHHLTCGPKPDHNGFVGLENVPVRNYGIWDGSKIKVVSYPPVNSGECNLNNACSFSPREYNCGNLSSIDYPAFRNQDEISPFMLDFKQRQNVLSCNGISDPVVALRSHYSSQQYSGSGHTVNGVVREESWGGQGDVGR